MTTGIPSTEEVMVSMKSNRLPYPWVLAVAINSLSEIAKNIPGTAVVAIVQIIDALLIPHTQYDHDYKANKKKIKEDHDYDALMDKYEEYLRKADPRAYFTHRIFKYHMDLLQEDMRVVGRSELMDKGSEVAQIKRRGGKHGKRGNISG